MLSQFIFTQQMFIELQGIWVFRQIMFLTMILVIQSLKELFMQLLVIFYY